MERTTRLVVVAAFAGSAALSVAMTATRRDHGLGLGQAWSWILTALQVSALYLLGKGHGVGWLLGAGVQLCWITYAVLTSQYGFVPGCLISVVVHAWSYLRSVRLPPVTAGEVSAADRAGEGAAGERTADARRPLALPRAVETSAADRGGVDPGGVDPGGGRSCI